jgi:hypothetical protein
MNAEALDVLSAHPYTTAGVIGAVGIFFAFTANLVKTVDTIKYWLKVKKKPERKPTREDVRDARVPPFGQRPSFAQGFANGAGAAFVGASAADAAFHATSPTHDATSTVSDHVGTISDHALHSGTANHAMDHADSIWDVLSGFFEAMFS